MHVPSTEHLKKYAKGLLSYVGTRKLRLLFGNATDGTMKHGNERENHQCFDKLRVDDARGEEFAIKAIG